MISSKLSSRVTKFLSFKSFSLSHYASVARDSHRTKVFRHQGFSSIEINGFFAQNQYLTSLGSVKLNECLDILYFLKLNKDDVYSLIISCPGVLDIPFLEKWKTLLYQLDDKNIPSCVTKIILEYSRKSCIDPDNLSRCVHCLEDAGLQIWTIKRVLERFPGVIALEEGERHGKIEFLKSFSFNIYEIDRAIYLFPEFLSYGLETRLTPLFDELKALGFSTSRLRSEIIKNPKILTLECGEFSRCLQLISSLKCRETIRSKILQDGEFKGVIEAKKRVDFLCKKGLILRDAFKILWKEPRVILYEVQSLGKKMEYLEKTMGLNVSCVADVPEYLGVSLEKRIVPRVRVIEQLRSENAICDEVGLKTIVKMSRMKFYNFYVKPYPQCEKIYGRFCGEADDDSADGLWKLAKAQRPSHSRQDLRNFKYFMRDIL